MIADENLKKVIANMLKTDAPSRTKALEGPKLIKYMNADGNPVTERPTGSTGTAGTWLDMTDSDSEP